MSYELAERLTSDERTVRTAPDDSRTVSVVVGRGIQLSRCGQARLADAGSRRGRRLASGALVFLDIPLGLGVQVMAAGVRREVGIRDRQWAEDQVDARPESIRDRQIEAG